LLTLQGIKKKFDKNARNLRKKNTKKERKFKVVKYCPNDGLNEIDESDSLGVCAHT